MQLAEDREKWQVFVSTVTNLLLAKRTGNVLSGLFGHGSIIIGFAWAQPTDIERASFSS
jgi:hypothetical protein